MNTVSLTLLMQCYNVFFFLKNSQSIANLVEIFNIFSVFSRLKPNLTKCKTAEIGALKGLKWLCVVSNALIYLMKLLKFEAITSHTTSR